MMLQFSERHLASSIPPQKIVINPLLEARLLVLCQSSPVDQWTEHSTKGGKQMPNFDLRTIEIPLNDGTSIKLTHANRTRSHNLDAPAEVMNKIRGENFYHASFYVGDQRMHGVCSPGLFDFASSKLASHTTLLNVARAVLADVALNPERFAWQREDDGSFSASVSDARGANFTAAVRETTHRRLFFQVHGFTASITTQKAPFIFVAEHGEVAKRILESARTSSPGSTA